MEGMGMKVLLTGVDGYIGVRMADYLLARGHDVVGLDSGFAAYPLADPVLVADITANGAVFGLGPFTGNVLQGFGTIGDYAAQIGADAATRSLLNELLVNGDEADADVGVEV